MYVLGNLLSKYRCKICIMCMISLSYSIRFKHLLVNVFLPNRPRSYKWYTTKIQFLLISLISLFTRVFFISIVNLKKVFKGEHHQVCWLYITMVAIIEFFGHFYYGWWLNLHIIKIVEQEFFKNRALLMKTSSVSSCITYQCVDGFQLFKETDCNATERIDVTCSE